MMQPSDLDTKILSLSPSYTKKQNRASDSTVPNHLSAVPKSQPSQINGEEILPKEVSQNHKNGTSEIPKADVTQEIDQQSPEEKLTTAEGNGTGGPTDKSLPASTKPGKEPPDLKMSDEHGTTPSDDAQEQGFWPVLKNPNFLALWGGQVFCQMADKVYLVLMIGLINTQFQAGGQSISGWVSALMMAFTIPAVLFGSVAGVYVDRWQKGGVGVHECLARNSGFGNSFATMVDSRLATIRDVTGGFLHHPGCDVFSLYPDPIFCSSRTSGDSLGGERTAFTLG